MIYKKINIIIFIALIISIIYAYPNMYGEDPAITILIKNEITEQLIKNEITGLNIKSIRNNNKEIIIRFSSTEDQFITFEKLNKIKDINISQNILNSEKTMFLEKIKAYPMKLGLDLRGGIHLVIKANNKHVVEKELKNIIHKIKNEFKKNKLEFKKIKIKNNKFIKINLSKTTNKKNYIKIINELSSKKLLTKIKETCIILKLNAIYKKDLKNTTIDKTISILTNRINELGIAETIIHKTGKNKITIELPGIQNIEHAKNIIGKTATLEFMFLAEKNKKNKTKLIRDKNNNQFLLKNKSIIKGEAIINASSGFENIFNKPCVNIKIDKKNSEILINKTKKKIGKPMAIIYKETSIKNNKEETTEQIISIANIMSPLGEQFQITGLNIQEAQNLALLLRAGSLPTTLSVIEEKIIGPSLGENNIKKSTKSLFFSLTIIMLFMIIRYKKLGIVSSITLIANITLLIAIMSIIGVTLTLSGLAGIILTIGMSIDSNILIFERIKEESKISSNMKIIVDNGFKNALSSITDANITTLLIALTLFIIGSGPIKGFAITLSLGIITSIYSSLIITKNIILILLEKKIKII